MKYCNECHERYPDDKFDDHDCDFDDAPIDSILSMLAVFALIGLFLGFIFWLFLKILF